MKILQVISTLSTTAGGPTEGAITQHRELTSMGHTAHLLTVDPPDAPVDSRVVPGTAFRMGPHKFNYGYSPHLAGWLRANARNYDVIVIHGLWQYHGFCVRKIANEMGVPYVVFYHGMLDDWFRHRYPLKHLKKWLYWPFGDYRIIRDARFALFTTTEEKFSARKSFWAYKARENVVGYGIRAREYTDSQAEFFLSQFPALRGKRLVLFLSRIHPKKGCDLLVNAFAAVAGRDAALHLVIAGPDQVGLGPELIRRAEQLGIAQRISIIGMLEGRMKWGAYDASEVFTLPSHQENFGIVLAEAMASGRPVLTTTRVNIWREIQEDGAGLIDEDTAAGTERLLNGWLDMSEAERQLMRERAVRCFNDRFEIRKVAHNLSSALESAARDVRRPFSFSSWSPWSRPRIELT